jgi:hypothetical protein
VTFNDGGKGGTYSNPIPITDSNGFASTSYTLPTRAFPYTITVSSPGLASAIFKETAVAAAPSRSGIVSGNNQSAPVSSPLPVPLVVAVTGSYGNPISGFTVTFSDGSVGGTLSATSIVTNNLRRASVTYMTPPAAGTVRVTASASGLKSVIFTVTVTAH